MITVSSFYVLFAIGMALVFGVMKVVNFAHGELYMLGGYALWIVLNSLVPAVSMSIAFFIALIVGAMVVGVFGLLIERVLFRPLKNNLLAGFLASMGLAYILQVFAATTFGVLDRSIPVVFAGGFEILGGIIPTQRLVVLLFSIILVGALWIFLVRTKLGRGLRATSQNPEAALLQGINFNRMSALALGIGSSLAAVSGSLMGSVINIGPFMGFVAMWKATVIIVVGGMGSIGGAILAALLFGTLDSLIMTFGLHKFVVMIDALILLIVLAFRPQGLLGREKL
jgi:branched-chain amino acid transport system permease protein